MAYYSELLRLKEERFFRKLALSSIYIYTVRFLDFALVTWLLTNIVKSPSSVGLSFCEISTYDFFRYDFRMAS